MLYHILRFIIAALGSLPLAARSLLGRLLGSVFALIPTRDRRIARLQLDVFMKAHGGRRLLRRVYAGLGQTFFESLNLRPLLKGHIACDRPDVLAAILAKKRGIVALTAHTGNWDLMAAFFIRQGLRLSTVGREARSPSLQRLLTEIRSGYGVQTLWRAERETVRRMIGELNGGHVVAALIDQDTRVASLMSPFLGLPAKTPSTMVDLARKHSALIVASFVFRTGFIRYRVFLHEIDAQLPTQQVLDRYHQLLGEHLQSFPEQWVWMHKRWRTLPDGETLSSRRYAEYLRGRLDEPGPVGAAGL